MESEKRSAANKGNGVSGATAPAPSSSLSPVVQGDSIHRVCPIDLRPLPAIAVSSESEVTSAVERARRAQRIWRNQPFEDRAAALKRAAKNMLDRRAEILQIVKMEVGKVDVDALFTEALGPVESVSAWSRLVGKAIHKKVRLNPISFPKKRARIELVPRGVIGVIAPWNYPVSGLYRSLFPALLTGNGVVLKPSEYTPESSRWLADQLANELPEGLIQVVQGDGAVGARLIDAGIDACVFTGSVRAGKKVRVHCAEVGIPCSVEMGGNDPAIVLADCDLDRTVAGLTHWALQNAGQSCGAVEIAYVDRRIADRFAEKIGEAWRKLRTGEGDFGEVEIAPLQNRRQLEIVKAQVADAIGKGAKLVAGGQEIGPGLSFAPTVLDHCTDAMDVVREETFGPVLAIVRIDGAADAIRRTNEGRYGLGASIWTSDIARAERLADRLDVGVVDVNNHSMTGAIADLPWSGVRETGFGIANSEHSLTTFARPKAIFVDENAGPEPYWMPFDASAFELGDILADAQLAKIGRAWKLPFLIQKRLKKIAKFFSR
jgi:acyl-CoA reductase-like NAD-dependent aldehyde dehydrogenase